MVNIKMKRDISKEILNLKTRKEFDSFYNLEVKIKRLENMINNLDSLNEDLKIEVIKYIPVYSIALLQSVLRSFIKKTIDRNPDCFERAERILKEGKLKIDFEYFKELHKKKFSFGEFISHQISCNKVSDIEVPLSILLLDKNAGVLDKLIDFIPNINDKTVINNASVYKKHNKDIITSLAKMFELRHVICHEMALNLEIKDQEIRELNIKFQVFLCQLYAFMDNSLNPDKPMSKEEYLQQAKKECDEAENRYRNLLLQIKQTTNNTNNIPTNFELFDKANEHWEKFLYAYVEALVLSEKDDFEREILRLEEITDGFDFRIMDLEFDFPSIREQK